MEETSAVKMPPFNFGDPQLWFLMAEASFQLAIPKPITASATKYNYCVSHLSPEAATIVRDIITCPDKDDPYKQLKEELIKRCGESKSQEIRCLLTGEQLGDQKPTDLLRGMQRRAENHQISDTLLLELFLQQLPKNVQSILLAISPLNATKAAEIADRIMEVTPPEEKKDRDIIIMTVYRPTIPYQGIIPGGMYNGRTISINGKESPGAQWFEINLTTGLDVSSDRALHLSVRFDQRCVVLNSFERGCWSAEKRQEKFPFSTSDSFFILTIRATRRYYRISVNGQHYWKFKQRIKMERVNSISINGSVQIHMIEFFEEAKPGVYPGISPNPSIPSYPANPGTGTVPAYPSFPAQPTCPPHEQQPGYNPGGSNLTPVYNPSIPYAYPIYGGLKPGMMVYISGRPSASAQRFTINFQNGTAPYIHPDIGFHFDARFFSRTVVCNSRANNVWGGEENLASHFPFQPAVNFDMIVLVEFERFMVAVNGMHFVEFRHRLKPLEMFNTLYIENDIIVSSIRFA